MSKPALSLARRAALNFSGQFAGMVVTFVDRVLFTGLLIRAWGVDLFSDWATLMAAAALLSIAEFGFQSLLGNMLVRAENRGRRGTFQRIFGIGLFFYLVLSALLVVLVAAAVLLADMAGPLELLATPDGDAAFLALALYQILRLARNAFSQPLRGKGQFYQLMWIDVRAMTAAVALSAAAVLLGADLLTVAFLYLAAELVVGEMWVVWLVRRKIPELVLRPAVPTRFELRSLAAQLPWYAWLTLSNSLMLHLPVLILAWLGLSGAMLIAFVVQRTLVNFGRTLANAASLALGIEITDLSGRISPELRRDGIRSLARFNLALATLLAAFLLAFGEEVVRIWTGEEELGSLALLFWLLLPLLATAPAIPLQILTFFGGRPRPQAVASVVQVSVGLVVAVLAGSAYGVVGVAFGVAMGEIAGISLVLPILAARYVEISYPRLAGECALFFLVAGAWAGGSAYAVLQLVPPTSPVSLAAGVALWAAAGGLPVAWIALPGAMRQRLLAVAAGIAYRRRRTTIGK